MKRLLLSFLLISLFSPPALARDECKPLDFRFAECLVVGGGFGFASGPVSVEDGDSFEGLGGYFFVGREIGGFMTLGGKFEGYTYRDAPYDFWSDRGVDQALYEVGLMSRFHPLTVAGLRPYVGADIGIYTRIYPEDDYYGRELNNRVEPGLTGRGGLEITIIRNLAVDFGASYSIDNNDDLRLEVLSGYVGAVYYFK